MVIGKGQPERGAPCSSMNSKKKRILQAPWEGPSYSFCIKLYCNCTVSLYIVKPCTNCSLDCKLHKQGPLIPFVLYLYCLLLYCKVLSKLLALDKFCIIILVIIILQLLQKNSIFSLGHQRAQRDLISDHWDVPKQRQPRGEKTKQLPQDKKRTIIYMQT